MKGSRLIAGDNLEHELSASPDLDRTAALMLREKPFGLTAALRLGPEEAEIDRRHRPILAYCKEGGVKLIHVHQSPQAIPWTGEAVALMNGIG